MPDEPNAPSPSASGGTAAPPPTGFWRDARTAVLALLCALVVLYIADFAVLGCRIAFRSRASVLSTVTVFDAARLKDNKLDIFYDQPEPESCVRSIFPHLGSDPCWYARRHTTRVVN